MADVECSVSGAFFRGYPRVCIDSVESFTSSYSSNKVDDPLSNDGTTLDAVCCANAVTTLNELKRYGHVG